LRVPGKAGGWYGTGFLAGPGLLVTNHHVLSNEQDASQAEAEFDYEHDFEGVLKTPVQFNLAPETCFFTDIDHDITFVGINDYSDGGVPLYRYGWLPMLPLSGKGLDQEWVTIPQHPGGQPKQLSVRANRIIDLSETVQSGIDMNRFIHYTNDTRPGSSGAPVLNDQWQVVAVHHKAVPSPNQDMAALLESGKEPKWIANEGVRVSSLVVLLEELRFSNADAAKALDVVERGIGLPSRFSSTFENPEEVRNAFEKDPIDDIYQPAANFYEKKLGKDPVQFSRGHLVRRFDPCWGDSVAVAKVADSHTFHYTNAAPQVQGFNAGRWLVGREAPGEFR